MVTMTVVFASLSPEGCALSARADAAVGTEMCSTAQHPQQALLRVWFSGWGDCARIRAVCLIGGRVRD